MGGRGPGSWAGLAASGRDGQWAIAEKARALPSSKAAAKGRSRCDRCISAPSIETNELQIKGHRLSHSIVLVVRKAPFGWGEGDRSMKATAPSKCLDRHAPTNVPLAPTHFKARMNRR